MRRDRSAPPWERAARHLLVVTVFLGLASVGVAVGLRARFVRDVGNPYEVDLSVFKKIDPALVDWVEAGSFPVPLLCLRALAVEQEDRILVGGAGRGPELLRFDSEGFLLERIPAPGLPHALASGAKGEIYLGLKDHIEVLRPGGGMPEAWASLGENAFLTSIAADGEDVLAADGGARLVWRFDLRGTLRDILGKRDPSSGERGFLVPGPCFDLALGPAGELWVADPGRHRVQHRRREGTVVSSWGFYGFEIEGFSG